MNRRRQEPLDYCDRPFNSQVNSDAARETLSNAAMERMKARGGTPTPDGGEVIRPL